jgi:hypothetical protein
LIVRPTDVPNQKSKIRCIKVIDRNWRAHQQLC